jgi:stage II sporulation protein D
MQGSPTRRQQLPVLVLVLLCALFATACGKKNIVIPPPTPAPPPPAAKIPPVVPPKPVPVPPEPGESVRGPNIRIRLTVTAREIRITSAGEFQLVEKTPETPRHTLRGTVQVRLETPRSETTEIYRIQVASLTNRDSADRLSRQLAAQFELPADVRVSDTSGMNQVRVGIFPSRREAQDFANGPLAAAGYGDALVVRDVGGTGNGKPGLVLRGPDALFRVSGSGYLFLPGPDANFLKLNDSPYRGILDLSLGEDGRLIVVNELGVEEYLLGVVPAELSPTTYPEVEAQAAQAIAARTYALKNMGRYRSKGFDLTDDSQTQVYGGVAAEREGSSKAVQKTAGMAIYYDDSLIDAMYTSTCGGRTEDSANVFGTAPVPYLTSVICAAENEAAESQEPNLQGDHDLVQVFFADSGLPANRELELARILGLTSSDMLTPEFLRGVPEAKEIAECLDRSRLLAARPKEEGPVDGSDITSRAGFVRYAAQRFYGKREIERRVSQPDASYYLGNFIDGGGVPTSARLVFAYLIQRNLWQPYTDNSIRPGEAIQRGDALALLMRWILTERQDILKSGISADPAGEGDPSILAVRRGGRIERLRLSPELRLYKVAGGQSLPVSQLRIIGNERLAFHQQGNGEIDFLEVELSQAGAASDRFSPSSTWQVSFSRSTVSEKLRSLAGNVGEIQDLRPARLGNSGRVVQLEIIGTRRSTVVNGYNVRNALGLKDTLYELSRTYAEDGKVVAFVFNGRGWGHGIGLCQTGAVGMARAGHTAEEILKTYYQGVVLRKAY